MSQLVHEASQLGGALELQPHSGVPHTQFEIEDIQEDILLPTVADVNAFTPGNVITFQIPGYSMYTDLKKSYVRIRGNWKRHINGAPSTTVTTISQADNCGPLCGFPYTLFSATNLYYNGARVSPGRGGDIFLCFIDRIMLKRTSGSENMAHNAYGSFLINNQITGTNIVLNAGITVANTQVGTSTVYNFLTQTSALGATAAAFPYLSGTADVCLHQSLDQLDDWQYYQSGSCIRGVDGFPTTTAADGYGNYGADQRAQSALLNDTPGSDGDGLGLEYMYVPCLGGWDIDKLLPDRVEIRLELTVANYGANINSNMAGLIWQFQIQYAELILHHVKLNQRVLEQNSLMMIERPFLAPTYVKIYQKQVMQFATSIDLSSVYQGTKPKWVAVGIQDNSLLNNLTVNDISNQFGINVNPFWMSQGSTNTDASGTVQTGITNYVNQIFILVNGKQYPQNRPYQSSTFMQRSREYRAYQQISAVTYPNTEEPLISFQHYIGAYCWFFFLIDPSESNDSWGLTEDVNIEVHATLASSITTPANPSQLAVHIISYVPAMLEIDGARTCTMKTKSGAVLRLDESVQF